MKICVLGNSPLFIELTRTTFPDASLHIEGWRASNHRIDAFDLIVVCGIDQKLYGRPFREFVRIGYFSQWLYVRKLRKLNPNLKIIYVNTSAPSKNLVSRYDLAKARMAYLLSHWNWFWIINPQFIVTESGSPLNPKGHLHTQVMRILIRIGVIKTCTKQDLAQDFQQVRQQLEQTPTVSRRPKPKSILIRYPRHFIVDKVAKLIFMFLG